MILEFKCSNFRSIGDEIFFSMLATTDDSLENNVVNFEEKRFLKEAVIYGANGSGKSNFIKALTTLKFYIISSIKTQPGDSIFVDANKLLSNNPTHFFIQYTANGKRYAYSVEIDSQCVINEYLYYFPNGRKTLIFKREKDKLQYGDAFKKELTVVEKQFLQDNRFMLSWAANFSNVGDVKEAFKFFNNDLVVYSDDLNMQISSNWRLYSTNKIQNDGNIRKAYVDFMNTLGNDSLVGIESKIEKVQIPEEQMPPFFTDSYKKQLSSRPQSIPNVKLVYKKYTIDLIEESLGVQKLFDMFAPFVDIILNNKVLLIDEFDAHLHPLIVNKLLKLFGNNHTLSQLIFTSHDINLLDLNIFRRDQIWFTTNDNENRFTELFSLAEVKAVRKSENISKNYLLGKYNGIPVIDENKKISLLEG